MSQSEWEASIQRVGVVVGSLIKCEGKYFRGLVRLIDGVISIAQTSLETNVRRRGVRMRPNTIGVVENILSHEIIRYCGIFVFGPPTRLNTVSTS